LVDAYAENIARQKIRGELHALEGAVKRFGKGLRKSGFSYAGNVFDEQVAAREQGDQRKLYGFFLAVNGARNGALELRNDLRGSGRHWLKTPDNPVTKERLRCDSLCK
jgi:hypothetical protein